MAGTSASPSSTAAAKEFWGFLVTPEKLPTPRFERLLLGIANYINKNVAPWDVKQLTPDKLASFYRLVGGNYDPLFLDSPDTSLSFIYQSLGCFHSLQPGRDPFAPPSLPALTPMGFVRWQTVQLLLGPEEHVLYLQEAVKRFDLQNPDDGIAFPKVLPSDCLPRSPDREMLEWHEGVSEKLRKKCQPSVPTPSPLRRPPARTPSASRDEERSPKDAAEYVYIRPRQPSQPYPNIVPISPVATSATVGSATATHRPRFASLNHSSTYSPHQRPPGFGVDTKSPLGSGWERVERESNGKSQTSPHSSRPNTRPRSATIESVSSTSSSSLSSDSHSSPQRSSRLRKYKKESRTDSYLYSHSHSHSHTRISPQLHARLSRSRSPAPRSPRSASASRPGLSPPAQPSFAAGTAQGRRHSTHGPFDLREYMPSMDVAAAAAAATIPNVPLRGASTLSPPFFVPGQNSAHVTSASPHPAAPSGAAAGPTPVPLTPSPQTHSLPIPQVPFARGSPRNTMSHGHAPRRVRDAAEVELDRTWERERERERERDREWGRSRDWERSRRSRSRGRMAEPSAPFPPSIPASVSSTGVTGEAAGRFAGEESGGGYYTPYYAERPRMRDRTRTDVGRESGGVDGPDPAAAAASAAAGTTAAMLRSREGWEWRGGGGRSRLSVSGIAEDVGREKSRR